MAPLVTLVREVMEAVEGTGDTAGEASTDLGSAIDSSVEIRRKAAVLAAEAFSSGLEACAEAVVRAAAPSLRRGGTVGTISASGTVRRLLRAEARRHSMRVICFESRPMNEGRLLAEALADAGADVLLAVDAAIDSLASACDVVMIGTDAIGDMGVTNKIGSRALARAARRAGLPVYVLADRSKLLPPGYRQFVGEDRAPDEVWEGAPSGVTVWNRYFELIPMELVSGIIMEGGLRSVEEVTAVRRGLLGLPDRP